MEKRFSQLTESEKDVYRKEWVKVLDTMCSKDAYGNRACDWGATCDRCHSDVYKQQHHSNFKTLTGITIVK